MEHIYVCLWMYMYKMYILKIRVVYSRYAYILLLSLKYILEIISKLFIGIYIILFDNYVILPYVNRLLIQPPLSYAWAFILFPIFCYYRQ